ncbi:MAG: amidohydrolase family protein, partial [Actinomycetes bacterium]
MADIASTVIRRATILSMDADVGDFAEADLLVEGDRISAVGRIPTTPADAEEIDGEGCIVVPGFVDTHRHMWEAIIRGCAPGHGFRDYLAHVLGDLGPALTPHDLYLGDLLSARSALASGVTTVQDIANIQDTPEHTDAIVAALQESGLRAVFAYGKSFPSMLREGGRLPSDVHRVRSELLADPDALVTMALDAEGGDDDTERDNAALARDLDVRVARHFSDRLSATHLRDIGALLP